MLSFEQKLQILESFPELQRKNVSLGRVNFLYEESQSDKKIIALHFHPNGNGFIYAGHLHGYDIDERGYVNIREFTTDQLKELVDASIIALSTYGVENRLRSDSVVKSINVDVLVESYFHDTEVWMNDDEELLTLKRDDDLWYVYTGHTIEMVFGTIQEAKEYLWEEGFKPSKD